MSNFSATIPSGLMLAANAHLEGLGYGQNNFSLPTYAGVVPSHGLMHAWGDPGFELAVAAITGTAIEQGSDPILMTSAAAQSVGSTWSRDAQELTGVVSPGLFTHGGALWWVIQSYNTATYPNPTVIPALVRRARIPGEAQPWVQPIDQYDAYKLINPFTGDGDLCTHNSKTWRVTQADGAGNNVWEPGVFGWTEV